MKVLKFGGTSVGTVASLSNVKRIVEAQSEPVIVVVSALGGVTDLLIKAAETAARASEEWKEIYATIVSRHDAIIDALVPEHKRTEVRVTVDALLAKLKDFYTGIYLIEDLSARTLCRVVSFGERLSSFIISYVINGAAHFDSLKFIKTENWFGRNIAVTDVTNKLIAETFATMSTPVAIVPGFISTDRDNGDITNLGRGGSDYTAALIAAALNADTLEIWTDVDGFMTADPRIIKTAKVIPHLTFLESMDLCNFGAKVIYPPTIYPVFHKNIPIKILNTLNPSAPGTLITDAHNLAVPQPFRGVSSIAEVGLIELQPNELFSSKPLRTRALNVFSKKGVEVLLSSTPETDDCTLKFALRTAQLPQAVDALREDLSGEAKPEMLPGINTLTDVSTVTVVGENLKKDAAAADRMIRTLHLHGIDTYAAAKGSSGFAHTAVIANKNLHKALAILHANFLE